MKRLLNFVFTLSLVASLATGAFAETFNAYGDSITSATPGWVGQLSPVKGAVSGDQAADLSKVMQGLTPSASKKYTLMIGTNDIRTYKNDAGKKEYFKRFLRQSVAWPALLSKVKARDAGMTYTGTWSNTAVNSFGKYTTANGATAQATVSGNSAYVCYIIQNYAGTDSAVNVEIDSNLVGTLSANGSSPSMNTVNGSTYSSACQRYTGLGAGSHTVKLTVTSANGKYFYLDYIAGSAQASTPKILLSNIIRMTSAAYTSFGITDATTDAYNDIIDDLIAEFSADGLNVTLVDNHAVIDPATDLQGDGVHPDASGEADIANETASHL